MTVSTQIDDYIAALPSWQQKICNDVHELVHRADPDIKEEIKFTNRPYFTLKGNVCSFLAAKDHVNVFIYDPIAPDPTGLINQGEGNATARAIQIYKNDSIDADAFIELIRSVVSNNRNGGWRKLNK